jgi:hypothetical protein
MTFAARPAIATAFPSYGTSRTRTRLAGTVLCLFLCRTFMARCPEQHLQHHVHRQEDSGPRKKRSSACILDWMASAWAPVALQLTCSGLARIAG